MAAMQLKMGSRTVGKAEKRTSSAVATSRSLPRRTAAPSRSSRSSKLVCNAVIQTDRPSTAQQGADKLPIYTSIGDTPKTDKPRVVILGSGWGAVSMLKSLPKDIANNYEIVVVSPRNYFLYTPLLPAVATGTMEERSIVEPIRNLVVGKGAYYEAMAKAIDTKRKQLVACFPADAGLDEACFQISYDVLIVAVGSVNNTFGIQGVDQYCNYFKSIEDANSLRRRVSECFERAALPATPEEERKKLLSFVVVGGGPTGVEVAAEMYDMIHEDLSKLYGDLTKDVQIRVVELMDHVLSTYDRAISIYTAKEFKRAGIELVLNSRVAAVRDGFVKVVNKANEEVEIPFGACVWATGIAMNPVLKSLQEALPGQTHFRSILTDDYLRAKGSDGSIFILGDAATIDQPKALDLADELFEKYDANSDGKLQVSELRTLLAEASKTFSHLEEHARFMESNTGILRFNKLVKSTVSPLAEVSDSTELSREQFKELLTKIDSGLRALPATAQVARQQGEFLASLFASNTVTGKMETTRLAPTQPGFKYNHKGSLAYVGSDKAVMDVPNVGPVFGWGAGLLWKGFETYSQISFRNQCLVATDWLRTKIFGRDISRV